MRSSPNNSQIFQQTAQIPHPHRRKQTLNRSGSNEHLNKKLDDYIANVEKIKQLKQIENSLSTRIYGTSTTTTHHNNSNFRKVKILPKSSHGS